MMDWAAFFPAGTRVLALPGWKAPRVFLPAGGFREGWKKSALYPASRLSAQLYRLWQRFKAGARLSSAREARSDNWPVGAFARDALPPIASVVVLAGTPGPAQKFIVQFWGEQGEILGYLKYGEKPAARNRIVRENEILSSLPDGVAPRPLKFGPMGGGAALLMNAIPGFHLNARLPPPDSVRAFLDALVISGPTAIDTHPWVRALPPAVMHEADSMLSALAGRCWPVVAQHGDFAPWNVLQDSGGDLRALDWEYGSLPGFPHLDLAHYIIQTAALIYRWPPERARDYAVERLTRAPWPALEPAEALAVVRLAALDTYWKQMEDGQKSGAPLQAWRRRVWAGET